MSWASIANNQCISFNNLQDAVTTSVFALKAAIPVSLEQITKTDADTYVYIDTAYGPYAAKASNQLVVKSDLQPPPTTTTTTTSAPPPTTTTTTSLLGDTFYITNSSTNSTITNITVSAASFYFLNVGTLPVGPSQTASGTQSSLTSANIDVDVTQSLGNACLKLYVNNIVVSQLNVGSTGIYTFTTITFGTSDLVEFEIVDGTC